MNEALSSLKLKRGKSPQQALDQAHLDSISALNDKVIADAFKDKDIPTALSLLAKLEHEIKVIISQPRTANTAPTPAVASTSTITCSSPSTTLHWPSSRTTTMPLRGFTWSERSATTRKSRASSRTDKKILSSTDNLPNYNSNIVAFFPTAICTAPSMQASAGSSPRRKKPRQNHRKLPNSTSRLLRTDTLQRTKGNHLQLSRKRLQE